MTLSLGPHLSVMAKVADRLEDSGRYTCRTFYIKPLLTRLDTSSKPIIKKDGSSIDNIPSPRVYYLWFEFMLILASWP